MLTFLFFSTHLSHYADIDDDPNHRCCVARNAARALGNPSLYRKMEAASQCIKRDIVFAASLYVT